MKINVYKVNVFLVVFLLIFAAIACAGVDLQTIKNNYNIVMEEDIDGDGNTELVSTLKKPNDFLTIFHKEGDNYIQINADKNAEIGSEITAYLFHYVTLNTDYGKRLIIYGNLTYMEEGKDFNCGNLIMIFSLSNGSLKMVKKYYSLYQIEAGAYQASGKIADLDNTPLGRDDYFNLQTDNSKTHLLMQSEQRFYIMDGNGNISSKKIDIPSGGGYLLAFRVMDNDVELLAYQRGNKYLIISGKNKPKEIKGVADESVLEVKMDENNDRLYFTHIHNNSKMRTTFRFNRQTEVLQNETVEMLEPQVLPNASLENNTAAPVTYVSNVAVRIQKKPRSPHEHK
jgi:hypothetical protein